MDITWYKTRSCTWDIEPVEVLKVTAVKLAIVDPYASGHTITVNKVSRDTRYWQTRQQAVEYLRERLERLRYQLTTADMKFAETESEQ